MINNDYIISFSSAFPVPIMALRGVDTILIN